MSLTTARLAVALDAGLSDASHVVWSENGAAQSSNVAPTAVTLKSATAANPSVKANDGALTSAAASDACTITHWAFAYIDESEVVTLRTTWNALTNPVALNVGGKITVVDGALSERLAQTTSAPS